MQFAKETDLQIHYLKYKSSKVCIATFYRRRFMGYSCRLSLSYKNITLMRSLSLRIDQFI